MMTIKQFIRWLESQGITDLYGGYIPKGKTQVLGVYVRDGVAQPEAYGSSSYSIKPFTILIHWTKAIDATEDKAISLYRMLHRARFETNEYTGWIECPRNPVDVGKDDNGVCEFVLDVNCYVKTK